MNTYTFQNTCDLFFKRIFIPKIPLIGFQLVPIQCSILLILFVCRWQNTGQSDPQFILVHIRFFPPLTFKYCGTYFSVGTAGSDAFITNLLPTNFGQIQLWH